MNQAPLKPHTILFLSTGNAARSILAEVLLNATGSEHFNARSAGYRPLPTVHPETLQLLAQNSLPYEGLHPKGWDEFQAMYNVLSTDIIITLSEEAKQHSPQWLGEPVRVHWSVDDPLGADKDDVREWKFKKCFTTLQNRIQALIKITPAATPGGLLLQLKDIGMVV